MYATLRCAALALVGIGVLTESSAVAVAQGSQLTTPPGAPPTIPPFAPPAPAAVGPAASAPGTPATRSPVPVVTAPAVVAPSGVQPLRIGPVEITPSRVVLRQVVNQSHVCLEPVVRVRATNVGTADLRVALISEGLSATDDLGITLLRSVTQYGVAPTVVGVTQIDSLNEWNNVSTSGTSRVTLLAPGQSVGIQLTRGGHAATIYCREDPSGDFRRSYRPSSVTFTANLGVIDISGNPELRTLSLFDIPIDLTRN